MSKVNSFDRQNIRQINAEISKALATIANKYDVEISLKNTRFTSSNFSTKIEVCTVGQDGVTMTKEALDFNRYKSYKGINANLGDSFDRNGKTFTVIGYKPRSTQYPILASCSDGKTYKLPISLVNSYINA